MRRNLARTRDTLTWETLSNQAEVKRLMRSAQETELDYRTKPMTDVEDARTTVRFLVIETLEIFLSGVILQVLRLASPLILTLFLLPLAALCLLIGSFRWVYPAPLSGTAVQKLGGYLVFVFIGVFMFASKNLNYYLPETWELLIVVLFLVIMVPLMQRVLAGSVNVAFAWAARIALAWAICIVLALVPSPRYAYTVGCGLALLAAAAMSHLVTLQYAAFLAANERLPRAAGKTYRRYLESLPIFFGSQALPELQSYTWRYVGLIGFFAVGFAVTLGVESLVLQPFAALGGMVVLVGLIAFFGVVQNTHGPIRAVMRTARALATFLRYDPHETTAAGVFRFPTRWLRPVWNRERVLSLVFLFVLTAVVGVTRAPDPYVVPQEPDLGGAEGLSQEQTVYMGQLPPDERPAYRQTIVSSQQKQAEARRLQWQQSDERTQLVNGVARTWLPALGIGLGLFLPIALFFLIFNYTSGELLCAYYDALEAPDATELATPPTNKQIQQNQAHVISPWDNRVGRILDSSNPDERAHFYLGRSLYGDYPVLLHEKLLERHAHILGSSGANKTSIGLAPLLSQILEREDGSILILDLKGDMSFFESARREASWVGLPFKWFTNLTGHSSYLFNPLDQSHLPLLTVNQQTQIALQALSLEYGEDYGRGYYSAMMETVLSAFLRKFPDIRSFRDLARYLTDKASVQATGLQQRDLLDAKALEVVVTRLAQLNALNFKQADLKNTPGVYANRINLPDLMTTPQVVYFYLSAPQEPKTVSMIGKLALFTLFSAAAQTEERKRGRVYIFADEFQRLLSQSLEIFFEQARSMKLSFILANQDLSQLQGKGVDVLSLVESCTAFKQVFTAHELETMQRLEQMSGEALYHTAQWTELVGTQVKEQADGVFAIEHAPDFGPEGLGQVNVREQEGPRLERNTVIEVSADQMGSFVRFSQSSGFTRFSGYITPIVSEYHLTEEEYQARATAPWPVGGPDTLTVTVDEAKAPQGLFLEVPKPDAATYELEDEIGKKLDRM